MGDSTGRRLPPITDGSDRDRQAIEEAAQQLVEQQRLANEERYNQVDRIRQDVHQQLIGLLGTRGLADLQEVFDRERRALREIPQPPSGSSAERAKLRMLASRRIDATVRELGTTSAELRALASDFDTRLQKVFSDAPASLGHHLESRLDEWLSLSPLHGHPLPWGVTPPDDVTDPHRWFSFRPPFWGFLFDFDYAGRGFRVDRELVLDPPAGFVGNTITADCDDPEFGDYVSAMADAQIAVPFTPPVAGILEVALDVQCLQGTYDLVIDDNFGFSHATATQSNWLMISVLRPAAPETQLASMHALTDETSGDDLRNVGPRLWPIQHYFAHLFSSSPVRADESIIVTAGTRSLDVVSGRNMDIHSRSDFRWFISSIEVRVVP
jgi:hypothetical protein